MGEAFSGVRVEVVEARRVDSEPQRQICATNLAFGDSDGKGLYITACEALYRIRLNTPGTRPGAAR